MAAALVCVACADAGVRGGRFETDGRWIRDAQGRVVLLRGINLSDEHKRPSASGSFVPAWMGPDVFQEIASWGLNSLRLVISWEPIEPAPGVYDQSYLDVVVQWVEWAEQAGLYVIVDMHQDVYARRFGGNGAPDWAVRDDGIPYEPSGAWFVNYAHPAVQRAFDHFWQNSDGLQDRYAAAWREVVRRVKARPNVVGYDIMNEPFPGSLMFDVDRFDREYFGPFTEKLAGEIREEDPDRIVFFEPSAMRTNVMAPDGFPDAFGPIELPNLGFAPHFYDPVVTAEVAYDGRRDRLERGVKAMQAEADRLGTPLWVGEWSAVWTADYGPARGEEFLLDVLDLFDQYAAGWAVWNYSRLPEDYLSLGKGTAGAWARGVIERPYPVTVPGPIEEMSFDTSTRRLRLAWLDDSGAEGEIRVPAGWSVGVLAHGADAEWDSVGRRVRFRGTKGTRAVLEVVREDSR